MEAICRIVTVFREWREGSTADGKTTLKLPNASMSTAAAISLVTYGLSLAAHFGNIALCADQCASMA